MEGIKQSCTKVQNAYRIILTNEEFLDAVESDTAGVPHTYKRLVLWGSELQKATGLNFKLPILVGEA